MKPHICDYYKDILSHKTTDYVHYAQLHVFYTGTNILNILYNIFDTYKYSILQICRSTSANC